MYRVIQTNHAPEAIGSYSQAIQTGSVVYLSGQIPLDPTTMKLVEGGIIEQVTRVFENIKAVTIAAGGGMDKIVHLTVYLIDISHTNVVNEVMKNYFKQPFPARTTIGVAALPKEALIEIDAIMTVM